MHTNDACNFLFVCRNIPLNSIILLNPRRPTLAPMKVSQLQVLSIPETVVMPLTLLITWYLLQDPIT